MKFYIFILLAGFAGFVCARDDSPRTNLQVLQNLYLDGFQESLQLANNPDSASACFINSGINRQINWLVNEQFFKAAKSSGFDTLYQVNDFAGAPGAKFYLIEFRSISQNIVYSAVTALPGDKRVRTAEISFYIQITAPDNRLLFSGVRQKAGADTILVKEIKHIENFEYSFTRGAATKSFFSSLLEPALVTVITGIVIYIFYSFRSK